jgi:hypothetical protein
MEVGNGIVVGEGAVKGPESSAKKNEVDDMQKRLDDLKNL